MSHRRECHHCGAEIDQDGHVWVHLDPVDPDRPELCRAGEGWVATPAQ